MPRVRVFSEARRPPRARARPRARRRGRLVATPWARDATGQPRIRLDARPWLPEYAGEDGRRWLLGWYDPTFGLDWYMPCDHELD